MNLMKNSNYLKWEKIIYHLQSLTNQNIVLYIKHIQQSHSTTKEFIYIYAQKISIRIRCAFIEQLQTKRFPIHILQLIYLYLYIKLWFIYISKHALFIFSLRNYANEHAYAFTNYFPEITKFLAIMMFINRIDC